MLHARARQYDIETAVLDQTVKEYTTQLEGLMQIGQGATLSLPKKLMVQWFGPLCSAIDREQAAIWNREPGMDRTVYGPFLILLPPEKLAVITMHESLNILLHQGGQARLAAVAERVGETVQAEVNMSKLKQKDRQAWNRLAQAAATGGAGDNSRHNLRRQARKALHDSSEWGPATLVKLGGALVHMLLKTAMVHVEVVVGKNGSGGNSTVTATNSSSPVADANGSATSSDTESGGEGEERLVNEGSDAAASSIPVNAMARQVSKYYNRASHPRSAAAKAEREANAAAAAMASAHNSGAVTGNNNNAVRDLEEPPIGIETTISTTGTAVEGGSNESLAASSSASSGSDSDGTIGSRGGSQNGEGAEDDDGGFSLSARARSASSSSSSAASNRLVEVPSLLSAEGTGADGGKEGADELAAAAAGIPGAGSANGSRKRVAAFEHTYHLVSSGAGFISSPQLASSLASSSSSSSSLANGAISPSGSSASSSSSSSTSNSTSGGTSGSSSSATRAVGMLSLHPRVLELLQDMQGRYLHPAHLPMLVPPKPWSGPFTGGFLKQQVCVMRTVPGQKTQISLLRHASMSGLYDALDVLGQTPWRINNFVRKTVEGVIAQGGGIAEIPPADDLPLPVPPSEEELAALGGDKERKQALKRFKMQENMVIRANADRHSLRCDMKLKMKVADQFTSDVVYFPHNVDFRGRAYPVPPHLNHMGADVCRGLLTFAQSKPLGDRGLRWLKIHLSNLMGKDKVSMDDRAGYTEAHMHEVLDSADKPLTGNGWWLKADAPWQALAACKELANAYRYGQGIPGKAQEYSCPLPVHQDGSCNGLQHYAALGRDEHGGRAVNLTPVQGEDRPQDVYSKVLQIVIKKMQADAAGSSLPPSLVQYLKSEEGKERVQRAAKNPDSSFGSSGAGGTDNDSLAAANEGADIFDNSNSSGAGGADDPLRALLATSPLSADARKIVAEAFACGSIPRVSSAIFACGDSDPAISAALKERLKMLIAQFLTGSVDRKVVKQTVMTSVYGVTFVGARQQILNRLKEKFDGTSATTTAATATTAAGSNNNTSGAVVPLNIFFSPASAASSSSSPSGASGSGSSSSTNNSSSQLATGATIFAAPCLPPSALQVDELESALFQCSSYLAKVTLESLGDLFSSADAIKRWLAEVAGLVAMAEQPMSWVTPLGLPVMQPYRREKSMTVKTLVQELVIVDNSEQLPVSVARQRSAFPPNYVHSLDSTHMMLTALDCSKNKGITFAAVHDSYWTHACDIDTMNKSLREQFIRLYSLPLLESFRSSLLLRFPSIKFPELPPRGMLDLNQVRDSTYFFS